MKKQPFYKGQLLVDYKKDSFLYKVDDCKEIDGEWKVRIEGMHSYFYYGIFRSIVDISRVVCFKEIIKIYKISLN